MHKVDNEIVGFLYADGCCMIIRQNRKRKYKERVYEFINYIPRVNITQRGDNLPLLEFIKKRHGGHISPNKSLKNSNPVHYWQIQSFEQCKRITDLMLQTEIPYSKKKAVKILNDFCSWRLSIGQRKFQKNELIIMEKWHKQIREANTYKE